MVTESKILDWNKVPKYDRWRQNAMEVTKYNPINRDENGHYIPDEWSCYSDIGKTFNGEKLTYNEYIQIEDKYVKAVEFLFKYYNCLKIQVLNKRVYYEDGEFLKDKDLHEFLVKNLKRRILNLSEVGNYVRLILRGDLRAMLQGKNKSNIQVRFDYDYYMYFNTEDHEYLNI